jgi:uncharacterized protein YggE
LGRQLASSNVEELGMKPAVIVLVILTASPGLCRGQVGGNVSYSQSGARAKAQQTERAKRVLTKEELPPTLTSMFVEASVLMNVKADEYVVVFAIAQEGDTVAECSRKMDATIKEFSEALKPLGIDGDDLFVDFVANTKIYGFEITGDIAREKLVGFELKKNVSIHYKDQSLLDKFIGAAARSQSFDLIKVDYIVSDTNRIQGRLTEEAARIIKQKAARYEQLLGIKLQPPGQVYADRPGIYYPTEMYDSYTAYQAEEMSNAFNRQKYQTQTARKSKTFFFNGLDADGFDRVINPVVIEPVVQFTHYLKVRYEVEQIKAK